VHRDLKPENILLDERGHIRLIDFGFAKKLTRDRTYSMCGTPEYIAPEVILNRGHAKAADMWSLGVVVYEMITGMPPFLADPNHTVFERIINSEPQYPESMDALARDFVQRLLERDSERRLVSNVRAHPWFSGIDWKELYMCTKDGPLKSPGATAIGGS